MEVAGFTTSVVGVTFLMVRTAFSVMPDIDALTTALPGCDAFTNPCVGDVLLTLAMVVPGHAHCTADVMSFELPSEYVPVAVKA